MIALSSQKGKRFALFGLGGSGLATARALAAGGAAVSVWDDDPRARAAAAAEGLSVVDLTSADWAQFDALVLSPGVPLTHPAPHWTAARARAAQIEIIGDVELFVRERAASAPGAPFIAVTGTNGKSTTTALIAHLLEHAGHDVAVGGNLGTPILALAPPSPARVHVVECSSFQIDLTPSLAPSVGVLLNLTPDHIDRHGAMEHYANVKARLVAGSAFAVIGVDDYFCRTIAGRRRDAMVQISARGAIEGVFVAPGSRVVERRAGDRVSALADLTNARALRGAHNAQNAAAALAAIAGFDLPPAVLQAGLDSFPGLPHRMEEVARRGRVLFVNDSKATNAAAAEKALLSFATIYWIVGGEAKEGGVEPLRPLFSRVRKAYLIGAAAEDFADAFGGALAHEQCGTLAAAVHAAARDAAASADAEPVVLLSPACASFDQFKNYIARGDAFRALAHQEETRP